MLLYPHIPPYLMKRYAIALASATFMFIPHFYPNSLWDAPRLENQPFAAFEAQRKCADESWIWMTNSYNPALMYANMHRSQFCKHADYVSNPGFTPVSVKDKL